jgi:hypothetical protein
MENNWIGRRRRRRKGKRGEEREGRSGGGKWADSIGECTPGAHHLLSRASSIGKLLSLTQNTLSLRNPSESDRITAD